MAFLGVGDSFVQGRLRQTHCHGTDEGPCGIQGVHGDTEALPFPADAVLFRNDHVFQDQFARIRRTDAHLVLFFTYLEARRVARYNERRQAADAAVFAGVRENQVDVGDTAVGDEGLGPVQGIGLLFLVMDGAGGNAAGIGTSARFGEGEGSQAAVVQHVAPHLLLRVVPGQQDRRRGEGVGSHGRSHAGTALAQFFINGGDSDAVQSRAAVLLRNDNVQQAHLFRYLEQFRPRGVFLIQLAGNRRDFLLYKLAHHLLKLQLVLV